MAGEALAPVETPPLVGKACASRLVLTAPKVTELSTVSVDLSVAAVCWRKPPSEGTAAGWLRSDSAGLAVLRDAAVPGDASSGDAAGLGDAAVPGDGSSGDAAGLGDAAASGDAVSGDAAVPESAAAPLVVSICGKTLVQELSLLPVLPLLISFDRGGSSKGLPVEATLDAACKAA